MVAKHGDNVEAGKGFFLGPCSATMALAAHPP